MSRGKGGPRFVQLSTDTVSNCTDPITPPLIALRGGSPRALRSIGRMDPVADLREEIRIVAAELASGGRPPTLERPPDPDLGDYSTNAAMLLAPAVGRPPREIAAGLRDRLADRLVGAERIEVA